MIIKNVTSIEFEKYGKIIKGHDCSRIMEKMAFVDIPEGVVYTPSYSDLESLEEEKEYFTEIFGEMPIQIGYCCGHNYLLNAVEYHKSSEVIIAVTDIILLLGMQKDIKENNTYETKNIEAFLAPKGSVVELFATSLHYAPCNADENGFKTVVVLPKNTNTSLEKAEGKEDTLLAKNKWLIAHEDGEFEDRSKVFFGLVGENISVKN